MLELHKDSFLCIPKRTLEEVLLVLGKLPAGSLVENKPLASLYLEILEIIIKGENNEKPE